MAPLALPNPLAQAFHVPSGNGDSAEEEIEEAAQWLAPGKMVRIDQAALMAQHDDRIKRWLGGVEEAEVVRQGPDGRWVIGVEGHEHERWVPEDILREGGEGKGPPVAQRIPPSWKGGEGKGKAPLAGVGKGKAPIVGWAKFAGPTSAATRFTHRSPGGKAPLAYAP